MGTVVSGEFCQGGVGDVLDCDIPTIPVGNGGTGNSSLTSGGLLIGNSSNAITVTAQPTDGQLLMGSTGIDPVLATISPTANETEVTNGTGSITVGLVAAPTVSAANMDSYPENFSKTLYRSTGLTDADDIGPVWRAPANAEITAVWCESDTGALSITLEDDLGNDLTTGCACSGGAACTLTGNVAYTAGERLEFIMVSAGTNNSVFFDVRYDLD